MNALDDPSDPENKYRTRESARQLRELLIQWDPIGTASVPEGADEYDAMISPLLRLLAARVSEGELEGWLGVQVSGMGLRAGERETHFAASLLSWWQRRAADQQRTGSA